MPDLEDSGVEIIRALRSSGLTLGIIRMPLLKRFPSPYSIIEQSKGVLMNHPVNNAQMERRNLINFLPLLIKARNIKNKDAMQYK